MLGPNLVNERSEHGLLVLIVIAEKRELSLGEALGRGGRQLVSPLVRKKEIGKEEEEEDNSNKPTAFILFMAWHYMYCMTPKTNNQTTIASYTNII